MAEVHDHRHDVFRTHTYHDGRTQQDVPCRKSGCSGIARVRSGWAPDTGMNWVRCCCCGDDWNPGTVKYAPGVGEMLKRSW